MFFLSVTSLATPLRPLRILHAARWRYPVPFPSLYHLCSCPAADNDCSNKSALISQILPAITSPTKSLKVWRSYRHIETTIAWVTCRGHQHVEQPHGGSGTAGSPGVTEMTKRLLQTRRYLPPPYRAVRLSSFPLQPTLVYYGQYYVFTLSSLVPSNDSWCRHTWA